MANVTRAQGVDEPSVIEQALRMFFKWALLRLWAYPTVAALIFGSLVLLGLVIGQRWLQLLGLLLVVGGAYALDRYLLQGRALASYRRWASARALKYKVRFMWDDLMDDLRLLMKYPNGHISRPRVVAVEDSNGAIVVIFDCLATQHLGDFESNAERFRTAFGGLRVSFKELAPGRFQMRVTRSDPLSTGTTVTASAARRGTTAGVPFGVLDTGAPMVLPLDQNHSLLGGIPGAGKSVSLNVALSGIAFDPAVQIVGVDCKEGIELTDWTPRLSALATDQESALAVLKDVGRMATLRARAIRDAGYRKQSDKGYTSEEPLWVIVVDECAELFDTSTPEAKKLTGELVGVISRLIRVTGRAGGISVLLATQKPTVDAIPSIIRDNVSYRVAFRCMTQEQVRAIFGDSGNGVVSPVSISSEQKGYCVVKDSESRLVMGRSAFIAEDTVRQIASGSSFLRRPLSEFLPPEPVQEFV